MSQKEKAEAIKKQLVVINQLLKKPENKFCADCKRTSPTWASVNLGVFVCINCSGCHREIGVHVTKIRSTNLDVWPKVVLNNFKIINNKIANKYWEYKLKKFDFKSLHSDNYKLVQFIRDKYENKKWVDPKKKEDPMSLIIKGKMKKYKKLYCEDEDEEIEEEIEEEEKNTKKNKKKKNKENNENNDDEGKKKKKKNKKVESDEENGDENDSDNGNEKKKNEDDDDEEEDNNNEDDDNKNENDEDFEEVQEKKVEKYESKSPNIQRPPQQINNIFLNLNNPNQNQQNNVNLNFNNTSNSSNNLVDIFSQQTSSDKKSQDLLNNINNAYFSPQPTHSSGLNNIFQQMPNNTGLNLQNRNNMQNNMQNMGMNNLNVNRVNSMQNMNQNMNYRMNNNMNFGMNNNFNMGGMNNNMNNNTNNANYNNNNNSNQLKQTPILSTNNPPSFNMEYFNQNLTGNKKNQGSTYNFSKNKVDPFSNLVSFKK